MALVAALAQLVEHRIRNAGATGSSPVSGTIFHRKSAIFVPRRWAAWLYSFASFKMASGRIMLTPSKSLLRVQVYFPKPENFGS